MTNTKTNELIKKKKVKPTKKNTKEKKQLSLKAKLKQAQQKLNKTLELTLNLQLEIDALKNENAKNILDFQDKAKGFSQKAQLEIDKFKKQYAQKMEVEQQLLKKYGSQKLLESTLEPIINLDTVINSKIENKEVAAYVKGFQMLLDQLYNSLEMFGVKKIHPQKGETFNPEMHFAILKSKKGKVIKQLRKPGFMLHDRVLKPAVVELK